MDFCIFGNENAGMMLSVEVFVYFKLGSNQDPFDWWQL
jgi:hypothetical protein